MFFNFRKRQNNVIDLSAARQRLRPELQQHSYPTLKTDSSLDSIIRLLSCILVILLSLFLI